MANYYQWFHGCAALAATASFQAQMRVTAPTKGDPMPFEDVMIAVNRWLVATEALAAVGAELTLMQAAKPGHPDVAGALQAVSAAAGLADLGELPPPQREMLIGLIRMGLHQAADLIDDPGRPPGWTFTDPAILQGWGRGSMVVPGSLASAAPELADVRSFLDVGAGIGLLAIAAARAWPQAAIVGIETWGPSLEAAAANVRAAGLDDKITIRDQDVTTLDDPDAYDCVWLPTFFVTEAVLEAAMPRLYRAVRPGGWLVLGRMVPPTDPLAQKTTALRTIRGGGAEFDTKRLVAALETAGCTAVRVLPRQGPAPLEYVIGQRPAV
jgi:SAM-dependent methyltransferase